MVGFIANQRLSQLEMHGTKVPRKVGGNGSCWWNTPKSPTHTTWVSVKSWGILVLGWSTLSFFNIFHQKEQSMSQQMWWRIARHRATVPLTLAQPAQSGGCRSESVWERRENMAGGSEKRIAGLGSKEIKRYTAQRGPPFFVGRFFLLHRIRVFKGTPFWTHSQLGPQALEANENAMWRLWPMTDGRWEIQPDTAGRSLSQWLPQSRQDAVAMNQTFEKEWEWLFYVILFVYFYPEIW